MTRRAVFGLRGAGSNGLFISPAGIDAYYASDDQLILNVSSKISQLIMFGWVGGSTTVALGLSRSPYVLITSRETLNDVVGIQSGTTGSIRPSPSGLKIGTSQDGGVTFRQMPPASATINSNGASMSIDAPRPTAYAVYNVPFT